MKLRMETYGEADGAYDDDGGTKKNKNSQFDCAT